MNAHEAVETRICKQPHCPNEAHYRTGVGAGYCQFCGRERYRAQQARGVKIRLARGDYGERRPKPETGGEIARAGRNVAAASRKLETAIGAVYQAEQRRNLALNEWREALTQLVRAANQQLPEEHRIGRAA